MIKYCTYLNNIKVHRHRKLKTLMTMHSHVRLIVDKVGCGHHARRS
jgi:hypothetical protein